MKRARGPANIEQYVARVAGLAVKCAKVRELEVEVRRLRGAVEHYEEIFETGIDEFEQCVKCQLWKHEDYLFECAQCDRKLCESCEPNAKNAECKCWHTWHCESCSARHLDVCNWPGCLARVCSRHVRCHLHHKHSK